MIIVDSTVWIDYLNGRENAHTEWFHRELGLRRFGLVDLVLCEVLQGIKQESRFNRVRRDLLKFEVFSTGGEDLAVAAARNYCVLRARGVTVRKTIDCIIATFCLQQKYALLHRDRDFDAFARELGLTVIRPVNA